MAGSQTFDMGRFLTPSAEDFQPNGSACLATFYYDSQEDVLESKAKNRPIFNDKIFIKILKPGGIDCIVEEATDEHKQRYPKAWSAFERQGSHAFSGTPIEELTFLTRSRKLELKAMNIMTVEHFASLDGMTIDRAGPGTRKEVEKAQHFLKAASDGAHVQKLSDMLSALQEQISNRDAEVKALKEAIERLEKETHTNGEEKGKKGRA